MSDKLQIDRNGCEENRFEIEPSRVCFEQTKICPFLRQCFVRFCFGLFRFICSSSVGTVFMSEIKFEHLRMGDLCFIFLLFVYFFRASLNYPVGWYYSEDVIIKSSSSDDSGQRPKFTESAEYFSTVFCFSNRAKWRCFFSQTVAKKCNNKKRPALDYSGEPNKLSHFPVAPRRVLSGELATPNDDKIRLPEIWV